MAEKANLLNAIGLGIPPSLGVLLGMGISNNIATFLKKKYPREIKWNKADITAILDAIIGYIGYSLSQLDVPFVKNEIYGVSVGITVGCWARLVIYILSRDPINLISDKVAGYGSKWNL